MMEGSSKKKGTYQDNVQSLRIKANLSYSWEAKLQWRSINFRQDTV